MLRPLSAQFRQWQCKGNILYSNDYTATSMHCQALFLTSYICPTNRKSAKLADFLFVGAAISSPGNPLRFGLRLSYPLLHYEALICFSSVV